MSAEISVVPQNSGEMSQPPDLISPQGKKLKQARISFKPVSHKALSPVQVVAKDSKKRKLSDPESPLAKLPKSVKPVNNPKTVHPENDNEVSSSSEAAPDFHPPTSILRPVCRKTLERFVCSVKKEEDITSTNDVIDLTDNSSSGNLDISTEIAVATAPCEEPMDVEENNKENEAEVMIIETQSKCIETENNVTKIIEQVASACHQTKSGFKADKKDICQQIESKSGFKADKKDICEQKSSNINKLTTSETKHDKSSSDKNVENETSKKCSGVLGKIENSIKVKKCTVILHVISDTESASKNIETDLEIKSCEQQKVDELGGNLSQNNENTGDFSSSPGSLGATQTESADDSGACEEDESVAELSSSFISPQTADDSFRKATSAGSTPRNSKPRSKVSSAKKAEREALRQKRKEEKERELQEKKRVKEEAQAEKERIRKEDKDKKEKERLQKEKEKQTKRDQMEKEKQERQQQKEDEKKKKLETVESVRLAKLEEKKKKEDEKRLLEEERRQKEEEKNKEDEGKLNLKKKMQNKFQSFFTKTKSTPVTRMVVDDQSCGRFMPFELKKDMKLAPKNFCQIGEETKHDLDNLMKSQDNKTNYLKELKSGDKKPGQWKKSRDDVKDDEVIIMVHDSDVIKKVTYHVKLIQFHTNYRPPYYGTWRKSSQHITPRNPWKTDKTLLDYEVDSDDEWEEEEPGESLSASEGEGEEVKDEEGGSDEEEDGWMVPDGYLSKDEECDDDEEVTPEMLKARQMAWEVQLKRKCQPQKAVICGCFWSSSDNLTPAVEFKTLQQYKVVLCVDPSIPIGTSFSRQDKPKLDGSSTEAGMDKLLDTPSSRGQQKRPVPEEAMPDLLHLIHGNPSGMKRLVEEFRMYWRKKMTPSIKTEGPVVETSEEAMDVDNNPPPMEASTTVQSTEAEMVETPVKIDEDKEEYVISKRQMEMRIAAIAIREKRSQYKKTCWYVQDSILKQYNLQDLPVPTKWQYVSIPNKKETLDNVTNCKVIAITPTSSPSELKPEQSKRPNDQRAITFFTKAKDAINKVKGPDIQNLYPESTPPKTQETADSLTFFKSLVTMPTSSPSELKPEQTKRPADQRAITFFAKAKDAINKADIQHSQPDNISKENVVLNVKNSAPENLTANISDNKEIGPVLTEKKIHSQTAHESTTQGKTNPIQVKNVNVITPVSKGIENKKPSPVNSAPEIICLD